MELRQGDRLPPVAAAAAAAGRSPASIAARRTSAAGMPEARATASAITPARAPSRSSPPRRRRKKVCSVSVAAAKGPAPTRHAGTASPRTAIPLISVKAASTPVTVSVGISAGVGTERSAAHPTPIWRWGVLRTARTPSRRRCGRRPRRRSEPAGPRCGRSWPAAPRYPRCRQMRRQRRRATRDQRATGLETTSGVWLSTCIRTAACDLQIGCAFVMPVREVLVCRRESFIDLGLNEAANLGVTEHPAGDLPSSPHRTPHPRSVHRCGYRSGRPAASPRCRWRSAPTWMAATLAVSRDLRADSRASRK